MALSDFTRVTAGRSTIEEYELSQPLRGVTVMTLPSPMCWPSDVLSRSLVPQSYVMERGELSRNW
jgi:hypothetical protein